VRFLRPYPEVVDVAPLYRPCQRSERLFARFLPSVDATTRTASSRRRAQAQLGDPVGCIGDGLPASCCTSESCSDYRRPFWRAARHALRRGQIDAALGMAFIAHHFIQFTREALRGEQNAVVLLDQGARGRARAFAGIGGVAQVGVGINHIRVFVIAGLDPAIHHLLRKEMDPRVKPGGDALAYHPSFRLERGRPQRAIVPVLERHGHDLRPPPSIAT